MIIVLVKTCLTFNYIKRCWMFTCMIAYLSVPVLIKERTGESLEMGVEGGGYCGHRNQWMTSVLKVPSDVG